MAAESAVIPSHGSACSQQQSLSEGGHAMVSRPRADVSEGLVVSKRHFLSLARMSILNFALHGAGARRMSVLEKGLLKLQEDLERGHRQLQALAAQGDAAAVAIHGILQRVGRVESALRQANDRLRANEERLRQQGQVLLQVLGAALRHDAAVDALTLLCAAGIAHVGVKRSSGFLAQLIGTRASGKHSAVQAAKGLAFVFTTYHVFLGLRRACQVLGWHRGAGHAGAYLALAAQSSVGVLHSALRRALQAPSDTLDAFDAAAGVIVEVTGGEG